MTGGKPGQGDDSWSRANEVSEAMLGLQPYADDSMMFVMRFGAMAKSLMRQQDNEAFMNSLTELIDAWSRPAEAFGGVEERSRVAAERRQKCLDLLKGFPDLEQDFDRFASCSRATARFLHGGGGMQM